MYRLRRNYTKYKDQLGETGMGLLDTDAGVASIISGTPIANVYGKHVKERT